MRYFVQFKTSDPSAIWLDWQEQIKDGYLFEEDAVDRAEELSNDLTYRKVGLKFRAISRKLIENVIFEQKAR